MNDRIKELAEQVGSTHKQNLGVYQFYTDELEKFAELIVRECADFLRDTMDDHFAAEQLEEHFGVES
jgi:hypothetical protein